MEFILTVISTVGVCQQQIPQQHFCRHHFCRAIQIHSRSLSRRLSPPQSPPLQRPSNSPCWRLGWRPVTPYNSRSTKLRRSSRPLAARCSAYCFTLISTSAPLHIWPCPSSSNTP